MCLAEPPFIKQGLPPVIKQGVLKGFVLGEILFLVHINVFCNRILKENSILLQMTLLYVLLALIML